MSRRFRAARSLVRLLPHRFARPLGRLLGGEVGAARLEAASALRFGLVPLCRRWSLEGWEAVEAARAAGRGMVAVLPPRGLPQVAVWPLGIYAGPLRVWGEDLLAGLSARHRERLRLVPVAGEEEARRVLATAGAVGVPWIPGGAPARFAARALETGVPLLLVLCLRRADGGWRVMVRPPEIPLEGADARDFEAELERAVAGAIEG